MKTVLLSGFQPDIIRGRAKNWWDEDWDKDIDGFAIVLDGSAQAFFVDPSDGYRSYGFKEDYNISLVKNRFPPVECEVRVMEDGDWYKNDVTELYSTKTGELICKFGTEAYNDYYPMGVAYLDVLALNRAL